MKKLVGKAQSYFRDVATEMRKASWPKRRELTSHTVITLVASVALALYIFGADQVISILLDLIYPGA